MTKLSVNINKIATLRNARGGNIPDVYQFAIDCETFGADGITVHPRPDERHITQQDCYRISEVISKEFNIEGYPNEAFLKLITEIKPHQATLVPDLPNAITSSAGWNIKENFNLLDKLVKTIQDKGVRVSLFVDANAEQIEWAGKLQTDRVELYTGPFAEDYNLNKDAIKVYIEAYKTAVELGIGVNAGHDLSLENLKFFKANLPLLQEVSIGHALISDALYFGIENTIGMYKRCLD